MTEGWVEGFAREATEGKSATEAVRDVYGLDGDLFNKVSAIFTGGSWSFDEDQIDVVIGKWEGLLSDLKEDRVAIQRMSATIAPPSFDTSSNNFVKNMLEGLTALRESNNSIVEYMEDFLCRLLEAKARLGAQEAANATAINPAINTE